MTDYPCLVDTDTIAQSITVDGYQADVIIDPSADNAVVMRSGGMSAPQGVTHSARIATNVAQNLLSDTPFAVAFNVQRWDTTGLIIQANQLRTDAPGLWLFGASVTMADTSGATGNVFCSITDNGGTGYGDIAIDSTYTGTAMYAPSPAEVGEVTLNPSVLIELPSGIGFGLSIFANFGPVVVVPANQILASSSPPTAVAGTNEMASCEFWCCLVRPL